MGLTTQAGPAGGATAPVRTGCALVTGASRGIGAAVALALAADGWPVAVNYQSSESAARAVAAEIEAAGGTAAIVGGDVTGAGAAEALIARAEEELGALAVLVNNAGVRADALLVQLDDEDWDRVLDVNLTAAFRLTRAAVKRMIRRRHGRVVNISSVIGLRANAGQANYAASKAALVAMTKSAAVEVARRGVTVNAVAPGFIATDMTEDLPADALAAVPARRAGRPEDVAACVRFLASDDAAYVTGATLVVDGGLTA